MKQPLIFFIFSNVTTVSGNITSPSVLPTRSPFSTEIPSYPKSLLTRSPFLPEVLSYPESFLTPKTLLSETPPFSTLLFFCSFVLFSFRSFLLFSFSPFLLLFFCSSVSTSVPNTQLVHNNHPRRPLRTHARIVYTQKTCQNNHPQTCHTPLGRGFRYVPFPSTLSIIPCFTRRLSHVDAVPGLMPVASACSRKAERVNSLPCFAAGRRGRRCSGG